MRELNENEGLDSHFLKRPRSPDKVDIFPSKTSPPLTDEPPQEAVESNSPRFQSFLTSSGISKAIWCLPNLTKLMSRFSADEMIETEWFNSSNGQLWRLVLHPKNEEKFIGIYVEVYTQENFSPQTAHFTLSLYVTKKTGKVIKKTSKASQDTFTMETKLIGYPKLISHKKNSYYLDKPMYVVCSLRPSINSETCRQATGYVGLVNEGTTCYMNSLLQTLFLITSFRKALYSIMPTDSEYDRIPQALRKLFGALQVSQNPPSTQELLKSFGWGRDEWHIQHDVQEFNYTLSETLERNMNGTLAQGTYSSLFKGKILQKIQCLSVDYSSKKYEEFIDLQLDVKGNNNIIESLKKYFSPVELTGDMQYEAEGFGKQDAKKIMMIEELPPVLQVMLKRFEYNPARGSMVKLNEKFEFYEEIDLDPYVLPGKRGLNKYRLFSILIHAGTLASGHYYAFISPGLDDNWFKFNDENVERALPSQVIRANWGGDMEDLLLSDTGEISIGNKKSDTSAYMLFYIRKSDRTKVIPPINGQDIPVSLVSNIPASEVKVRENKRVRRVLHCTVALASKETIFGWKGPGIAPPESQSRFFIYSTRKNSKVQYIIDTKLAHLGPIKLWIFNPGPVNWKFKEIDLNQILNNYAFENNLISQAIFIESAKTVFDGKIDSWSWDDGKDESSEESSPEPIQENGKNTQISPSSHIFVFVKTFNKGEIEIVGVEWLEDAAAVVVKQKLFEKYLPEEAIGWICIERCGSEEVRIEELVGFVTGNKEKKGMIIENGDCLIIGSDISENIPQKLREVASNVEVQVLYYDLHQYFNFMSFSKQLLERNMFPQKLDLKLSLSYTQHQVMKIIADALKAYCPEISENQINLLGPNMVPYAYSPEFFLSKILQNKKIYYDISQYDLLAMRGMLNLVVVFFDEEYCPLRSISIVLHQESTVKDACDMMTNELEGLPELFLYQQNQKAILNFLEPENKLKDIQVSKDVLIGIKIMNDEELKLLKDKKLKVNYSQRIKVFHAYNSEEGLGRPFTIIIKKTDTTATIKQKIVEKAGIITGLKLKVAEIDKVGQKTMKITEDLDENEEEFWDRYKNMSIVVEHKLQGMRLN